MLKLHDTATGQVTPLDLRDPGRVSMYVCGPTVYDAPHLGHGRFSLVFDVLRRYLLFTGLDVTYVSNITDIDDRIIERASERGLDPADLTATYERVWWEAMDALGVLRPDEDPHATAYVSRMVDLVADLVERGVAYETADGVYLSVDDVPGYGLLAHQPLDSLRSGARVQVDEEKRTPLDFVLWKKAKPGEPTWDSPWGPGRPGWHTECVVMSLDLLGDGFDLHGGAIDLIFPHHENERAQAVAVGREFARHWVHNGWVTVEGEKMSKSLDNFTSLDDLLSRSDARAYRLLVLRSHYRSPIEITPDTIARPRPGWPDWTSWPAGSRYPTCWPRVRWSTAVPPTPTMTPLATPRPWPVSDVRWTTISTRPARSPACSNWCVRPTPPPTPVTGPPPSDWPTRVALLCAALGLPLRAGSEAELDETTAELVRRRDGARAEGNWTRADALRSELEDAGWLVEDGPDGTRISRR